MYQIYQRWKRFHRLITCNYLSAVQRGCYSYSTRTATCIYYSYGSQKISLNFSVIADSSLSKLLYLPLEKLSDSSDCGFFWARLILRYLCMFLFSCAYAYFYVACVMLMTQVWTRLKRRLIFTHMSRNKKGPYSDSYLLFTRGSSSITNLLYKSSCWCIKLIESNPGFASVTNISPVRATVINIGHLDDIHYVPTQFPSTNQPLKKHHNNITLTQNALLTH